MSKPPFRSIDSTVYLLIVGGLFSTQVLSAQSDTTLHLPTTTIREPRFEQTGYTAWRADTLPAAGLLSLADRLDFPFKNTAQIGRPQVRQGNNRAGIWNAQQFNRLIINEKNVVRTAFWQQKATRQ